MAFDRPVVLFFFQGIKPYQRIAGTDASNSFDVLTKTLNT